MCFLQIEQKQIKPGSHQRITQGLLHPVTTNLQQLTGGQGARVEGEEKGAQAPKEEEERKDSDVPPRWLRGHFIQQPQTGSDITVFDFVLS